MYQKTCLLEKTVTTSENVFLCVIRLHLATLPNRAGFFVWKKSNVCSKEHKYDFFKIRYFNSSVQLSQIETKIYKFKLTIISKSLVFKCLDSRFMPLKVTDSYPLFMFLHQTLQKNYKTILKMEHSNTGGPPLRWKNGRTEKPSCEKSVLWE